MSTYRNLTLKIDEDQGNYAKALASRMSAPLTRKKGMVDLLGITSVINFFSAAKMKVDLSRSLHKTPVLLEEFKVTDIYYNNYRMDVITVFREKKIRVPRIHAEFDIMSDFYIVVQIGSMLKEAKVLGYLTSQDVLKSRHDNKFFYPSEDSLHPIEDLMKLIRSPHAPKHAVGKHLDCVALFLRFLDNELSTSHKKEMVQHVMTCESCLKRLEDLIEFDRAAQQVRKYPATVDNYYQKVAAMPVKLQKKQYPDVVVQKSAEQGVSGDIIINPIKITPAMPKKRHLPLPVNNVETKSPKQGADASATLKNTAIELIFGQKDRSFGGSENIIIKNLSFEKKKKIAVMAIVAIILLVGMTGLVLKGMSALAPISDVSHSAAQEQANLSYDEIASGNLNAPADSHQGYDDLGVQNLPRPEASMGTIDFEAMNVANGEPIVANINKISWEVPENVADKEVYKKFLQAVGKNIKLNLQNDLLLTNEFAKNNNIKIDIKFSSSGNVESVKVKEGSGSNQIDNIIKKSVSDTLSYIKPPNLGIMGKSVAVTLVIDL